MVTVVKVKPKKTHTRDSPEAYVRFSLKMLYINSDAMLMLPDTEYISIRVNASGNVMTITPETKIGDTSFKLSHVNETECARRIETNNALLSILDAGFPKWALGARLPVMYGIDGSVIVDLRPQIPLSMEG